MSSDKWLGVTLEARRLSRHQLAEKSLIEAKQEGLSLLLAGTDQGYLALLNSDTGEVKYSVKAHQGEIVAVTCSPKRGQVITASNGMEVSHSY